MTETKAKLNEDCGFYEIVCKSLLGKRVSENYAQYFNKFF